MIGTYYHRHAIQKSGPIRAVLDRLGVNLESVGHMFTDAEEGVVKRFVNLGATEAEARALYNVFKHRRTVAETEAALAGGGA